MIMFLLSFSEIYRVLDIIPSDWIGSPTAPPPVYPMWEHYARYVFSFRNVVDLICIVPYYVSLRHGSRGAAGVVFLRIFRLLRVFKILANFKTAQEMLNLVIQTMRMSIPALLVLTFLVLLAMIFFASIIFLLEAGTYTVNEDYPNGAYLRVPYNGVGTEVSPFVSIPVCFYWVITTLTTGN